MKDLVTIFEDVRVISSSDIDTSDYQKGLDEDELEAIVAVNMAKLAECVFYKKPDIASLSAFAGTMYSNIKDIQTAKDIYNAQFKKKKIPIKQL